MIENPLVLYALNAAILAESRGDTQASREYISRVVDLVVRCTAATSQHDRAGGDAQTHLASVASHMYSMLTGH